MLQLSVEEVSDSTKNFLNTKLINQCAFPSFSFTSKTLPILSTHSSTYTGHDSDESVYCALDPGIMFDSDSILSCLPCDPNFENRHSIDDHNEDHVDINDTLKVEPVTTTTSDELAFVPGSSPSELEISSPADRKMRKRKYTLASLYTGEFDLSSEDNADGQTIANDCDDNSSDDLDIDGNYYNSSGSDDSSYIVPPKIVVKEHFRPRRRHEPKIGIRHQAIVPDQIFEKESKREAFNDGEELLWEPHRMSSDSTDLFISLCRRLAGEKQLSLDKILKILHSQNYIFEQSVRELLKNTDAITEEPLMISGLLQLFESEDESDTSNDAVDHPIEVKPAKVRRNPRAMLRKPVPAATPKINNRLSKPKPKSKRLPTSRTIKSARSLYAAPFYSMSQGIAECVTQPMVVSIPAFENYNSIIRYDDNKDSLEDDDIIAIGAPKELKDYEHSKYGDQDKSGDDNRTKDTGGVKDNDKERDIDHDKESDIEIFKVEDKENIQVEDKEAIKVEEREDIKFFDKDEIRENIDLYDKESPKFNDIEVITSDDEAIKANFKDDDDDDNDDDNEVISDAFRDDDSECVKNVRYVGEYDEDASDRENDQDNVRAINEVGKVVSINDSITAATNLNSPLPAFAVAKNSADATSSSLLYSYATSNSDMELTALAPNEQCQQDFDSSVASPSNNAAATLQAYYGCQPCYVDVPVSPKSDCTTPHAVNDSITSIGIDRNSIKRERHESPDEQASIKRLKIQSIL